MSSRFGPALLRQQKYILSNNENDDDDDDDDNNNKYHIFFSVFIPRDYSHTEHQKYYQYLLLL